MASQTIEWGIITAMKGESDALVEAMIEQKIHTIGNMVFYTGLLWGHFVVLAQSGIGKAQAAATTALMIDKFKPHMIVNTGSCGGLKPNMNIGDVIIANGVAHHDVDVRSFGYEIGQLPDLPAKFLPCQTMQEILHSLSLDDFDYHIHTGEIVSGDTFLHDDAQIAQLQCNFPKAYGVDMESAAIGQICHACQQNFLIIRSISDNVLNDDNHISFEEFLPIAAKNSLMILQKLIMHKE